MTGSQSSHNPALTERGGIWSFYCPCGITRVGWTKRSEAEEAAAAHGAEPRCYGTCSACEERAALTIYGWCLECHPVEKTKTLPCLSCYRGTPVIQLWRTGRCFECQERMDSLRHDAALLGGI